MEDVIIKIVDMESEINADIDSLVDLKKEIAGLFTAFPISNIRHCLNCGIVFQNMGADCCADGLWH